MVVVTKYPTVVVDAALAWTAPNNVKLDDGFCASIALAAAVTRTLDCSGYGFAIPVGSTINLIRIFVDGDLSRVLPVDDRLLLFTLTKGGTSWGIQSTNYSAPPTCGKATKDYANVAGVNRPTVAELNAESFTTNIDAQQLDASATSYFCDVVGIEVTYTEPSAQKLWMNLKGIGGDARQRLKGRKTLKGFLSLVESGKSTLWPCR